MEQERNAAGRSFPAPVLLRFTGEECDRRLPAALPKAKALRSL